MLVKTRRYICIYLLYIDIDIYSPDIFVPVHDCAHIHNNDNSGHNHTRAAIFYIGIIKLRNISEGILLVVAEQ